MEPRRKKILLIATGLAVSVVALTYFLLSLQGHWKQVLAAFRRARYLCLVPGVGFVAILYWFRVRRWGLFLTGLGSFTSTAVASATCIGFMANCVLPARVGELIRPYVLFRKTDVRFGHALATSFALERAFDLMGLSLLMLITWTLLPATLADRPAAEPGSAVIAAAAGGSAPPAASPETNRDDARQDSPETIIRRVQSKGFYFVIVAVAVSVVLVCLALFPAFFQAAARRLTLLLPEPWRTPARETFRSVTDSMQFVKSARGVAMALVYSLGLWLAQGLSTYALAWGLGLDIGLAGAFLVVIAVALAVALPQGPAFIGPFHVAAMVTVSCFAPGQQGAAGAFAILMWLVNVVPITVVGLGFLWYEGLSLGKVTAASSRMEEENV